MLQIGKDLIAISNYQMSTTHTSIQTVTALNKRQYTYWYHNTSRHLTGIHTLTSANKEKTHSHLHEAPGPTRVCSRQ